MPEEELCEQLKPLNRREQDAVHILKYQGRLSGCPSRLIYCQQGQDFLPVAVSFKIVVEMRKVQVVMVRCTEREQG